jgi:hypothetical protein
VVYRNCIFCAAPLGANESVETFPVGRRVAFDEAKGRLWVVCRACERWNLSPIEERWEAIEACERLFRGIRTRVSTEHIGLARLGEGLELVRIGAPQRPEFAAWRYGDQFGRRRRRHAVQAAVGGGIVVGALAGSALVLGFSAGLLPLHLWHVARPLLDRGWRPVRVRDAQGGLLEVRPHLVGAHKLRPAGERGWQLELSHRQGTEILTGRVAVDALAQQLPRVNAAGASARTVRQAVKELDDAGGPEAYFHAAEFRARKQGRGYSVLSALPAPIRLALEMGAHEDRERAALAGELEALRLAWEEAEEVARIADELTVPDRVRATLERLQRVGPRRDAGHGTDGA